MAPGRFALRAAIPAALVLTLGCSTGAFAETTTADDHIVSSQALEQQVQASSATRQKNIGMLTESMSTPFDELFMLGVEAGPLFNVEWAGAPTNGLSNEKWIWNAGIEVKLTVLGTSVVLTYRRDLRSGNNTLFGTLAK